MYFINLTGHRFLIVETCIQNKFRAQREKKREREKFDFHKDQPVTVQIGRKKNGRGQNVSRSTLDYPLFSRSSRGSPAQPREAAQQLIPRNCPNSPLSNIRPTNPRLYTSASGSTTSHCFSPNNESLRFRSLLVQISLSFSPVFIYLFIYLFCQIYL